MGHVISHVPVNGTVPPMIRTRPSSRRTAAWPPSRGSVIAGPGFTVASAIGRGLAVGLGVGIGVGIGDRVASRALLVTTVGLGVAVPEQATTASSRNKIEPIRARRPVRTLSSSIIYLAVAP